MKRLLDQGKKDIDGQEDRKRDREPRGSHTVGKRTRKNRYMLKYILLDELFYEPACLPFTFFTTFGITFFCVKSFEVTCLNWCKKMTVWRKI